MNSERWAARHPPRDGQPACALSTRGVNVPAEISLSLKSVEQPLRDSIRELRRGYQSVSECLEQTMAECDVRGAELADCRRQLAESRRSLSECERQLAERARADADLVHRYATLKKQAELKQAELAQANDQALHAQAESAQSKQRLEMQIEQNQQSREQAERLETQCEALRSELAQLRTQFGPLAESATETLQLRNDLSTTKAELCRLQEQVAAARGDDSLSERLAAEQSQRRELENELDALRHRGAELTEALSEQKRIVAAEREQWNEELRQLRRAVEKQSELLSQRPAQTAHSEPVAAHNGTRPSSQAAERVIGSVLEQFEMLQKNKIRKLASSSG